MVQQSAFLEELEVLGSNEGLHRSSRLRVFQPILDERNVLRVGGRVSQAPLPYFQHHLVMLPKNHSLVLLIIHSEHIRLLHAGPTLVAASLRAWI